jgi:hypothetical protein
MAAPKPELPMIWGAQAASLSPFRQASGLRCQTSGFARLFDQLTFALSNCDPAASIKDQASA